VRRILIILGVILYGCSALYAVFFSVLSWLVVYSFIAEDPESHVRVLAFLAGLTTSVVLCTLGCGMLLRRVIRRGHLAWIVPCALGPILFLWAYAGIVQLLTLH
jgi:hypothetical protein